MIVSIYEEEDELVRKTPLDEALKILGAIFEKRSDDSESLCVCIYKEEST